MLSERRELSAFRGVAVKFLSFLLKKFYQILMVLVIQLVRQTRINLSALIVVLFYY